MTHTRQEIKAAIEAGLILVAERIHYYGPDADECVPGLSEQASVLRAMLETFDAEQDLKEAALAIKEDIGELASKGPDGHRIARQPVLDEVGKRIYSFYIACCRLIAKDKHADGCRCPECDPNFNDPREASDARGDL